MDGGTRDDRASESALGNLVADALRDSDKLAELGGADIGMVNPGGLRNELYFAKSEGEDRDGVVTFAEANSVLPFVNNVWTVELTGAQLTAALEQQWQTDATGKRPSRPYLALGLSDNVSWVARTADPLAEPGHNVLAVYVNGKLVEDDDTFTVSTFSFLAQGGDNFRAFTDGTTADTGLIDRDLWIAYLQSHPNLSPSFARTRTVVDGLPGTVEAGSDISVSISGLDLTSLGAPANAEVTASLVSTGDGVNASALDKESPLGSFPIDEGASVLTLTVPANAGTGEHTLVLTSQPSHTLTRLPITVTSESSVTPSPEPSEPGQPTVPSTPAPSASAPAAQGGSIATTGASIAGPVALAILLVITGGTALAMRRRRQDAIPSQEGE